MPNNFLHHRQKASPFSTLTFLNLMTMFVISGCMRFDNILNFDLVPKFQFSHNLTVLFRPDMNAILNAIIIHGTLDPDMSLDFK